MDLISGLAGLRTPVELTRALRDAAKAGAIEQDEFAGRVGEIYDYISDSKDALVDAKDEIQGLKEELRRLRDTTEEKIKELEARADTRKQMFFAENVCWKQLEDGKREGPYCPACYELKADLLHLITTGTVGLYDCKVCNNRFETLAYRPSGPVPPPRRWRPPT